VFVGGLRLLNTGIAGVLALALAACGNTPAGPGAASPGAAPPASNATAPSVFIGASIFGVPLESGGAGGRIEFLLPGGPAESAGLREGDIVTALGSKPVYTTAEIIAALKDVAPGTAVPVAAIRDGRPITLDVRPETRPADFERDFTQAIASRIENEEQAAAEAEAKHAYRRAFQHDVKALQLISVAQGDLPNAGHRFDEDLSRMAELLPKLKPPPPVSAVAANFSDRAIAVLHQARSDADNDAAAMSFGLAIHEAPWVADLYRDYGLVLAKAGNASGATSNLNRYLVLNPNASDAAATRQKVAELQPLADEQKPWRPFLGQQTMGKGQVDLLTLRDRRLLITLAAAPPNSGGYKSGDTLCLGTISGGQFRGRCAFKSDHPGFIKCFGGERDYAADGSIDAGGTHLVIHSITYVHYDPDSCTVDREDHGDLLTFLARGHGP
jgi:tetratricopeptide (TPR) repeat protein